MKIQGQSTIKSMIHFMEHELGLIEDDGEWERVMTEVEVWMNG